MLVGSLHLQHLAAESLGRPPGCISDTLVDLRERQAAASAAAASPAVHTADLTKRYGKQPALAGLTMTVPRGEAFGFLGPNGAGKTTAVKLLLGLAAPTSGEGWVLGRPLGDREARRRIGYLPELFRYQPWLSAREVLALHCELAGLPRASWREEVQAALEIVDLAGRAEDRVGTFSKGMQQRLGLGAALLGKPELVFLDEPTSALDPVGRHDVRQVINSLKERGTAVFLNSHLLTEVEMVCDRVAIVDHGRVVASGTLDDLLGGHAVRVRVTGLKPHERASVSGFGELDDDGEWITVRGLEPERVPELVDELVRLGGRVYSVEPRHQTLEDRFLQLLGAK
ncbi:MAG TPA: ABC transporter ATP-binding protein [Candidatus Dormibacteraeota bacterium]